jgi:hypothetical protein
MAPRWTFVTGQHNRTIWQSPQKIVVYSYGFISEDMGGLNTRADRLPHAPFCSALRRLLGFGRVPRARKARAWQKVPRGSFWGLLGELMREAPTFFTALPFRFDSKRF